MSLFITQCLSKSLIFNSSWTCYVDQGVRKWCDEWCWYTEHLEFGIPNPFYQLLTNFYQLLVNFRLTFCWLLAVFWQNFHCFIDTFPLLPLFLPPYYYHSGLVCLSKFPFLAIYTPKANVIVPVSGIINDWYNTDQLTE